MCVCVCVYIYAYIVLIGFLFCKVADLLKIVADNT